MDAALLFELLERSRKSGSPPLSEALTSAIGDVLLDWLAREHAETPPRLHREAFAKLGCMSPEQARGRQLDVRSDLFSAGLMLFELSCGRLPFSGIADLVAGELDSPWAVNPKLSDAFAAVLARALAFEPAQRFSTARELRAALELAAPPAGADALAAWVATMPPEARTAGERPSSPPVAAAPAAGQKPRPWTRQWAGMAAVAGLAVAATFTGLRLHEQHQVDVASEYDATLRPCELISDPPGAVLAIDGVLWKERAPTVVRMEPGRDYVVELRSSAGVAVRKVRDQKKLAVRLYDGSVTANDVYGAAPADPRRRATSAKPQPVAAPEPATTGHPVDFDLESAPAKFMLWPEHQFVLPAESCVKVTGGSVSIAPAPQRLPLHLVRSARVPDVDPSYDLPLFALYHDGGEQRLEVVDRDLEQVAPGRLCVFLLTDRSTDALQPSAMITLPGEQKRFVETPLLYVPGDDRLLIRTLASGSWQVKVEASAEVHGVAPVMFWEKRQSGARRAVVLDGKVHVVENPKWLWFTVPVRALEPNLSWSISVEKVR